MENSSEFLFKVSGNVSNTLKTNCWSSFLGLISSLVVQRSGKVPCRIIGFPLPCEMNLLRFYGFFPHVGQMAVFSCAIDMSNSLGVCVLSVITTGGNTSFAVIL